MRLRDEVEIFGHFQFAVIADVINPARAAALQRGDDDSREIIGVNVIGINVVFVTQDWGLPPYAIERKPIGSIDSGHAKDDHRDAIAFSPVP